MHCIYTYSLDMKYPVARLPQHKKAIFYYFFKEKKKKKKKKKKKHWAFCQLRLRRRWST